MDLAEILKLGQASDMTVADIKELIASIDERNERAAKREEARLEREREHDAQEREKDAQEREKERAHQIALASLKSGHGSAARPESEDESDEGNSRSPRPKIPPFSDNVDEMDAYLQRFEKLAKIYKWKESDYAVHLGTLLRGKALKTYVSLPQEVSEDYEQLKKALLLAYHVDADSYRRKFRESRVGDNESYIQLALRMEQYLDRWITLSDTDKGYEPLCDLLIRDQIIANAPYDLRIFLKERKFSDTISLAEAADLFRNARKSYKPRNDKKNKFKLDSPSDLENKSSKVVCHYCGEKGHISPNCPKNPKNFKDANFKEAKVKFVFDRDLKPADAIVDPNAKLFNKNVEVTLDTGCNTVIVNDSLVEKKFHNKKTKVFDYLGVAQFFPTARVLISCKYFSGWVNAIVAPIKFCDVLLGMVPGVRIPQAKITKDEQSGKTEVLFPDESTDETVAMSVQTRASKQKENLKPNSLVEPEVITANRDSFIQAQAECSSLNNIRRNIDVPIISKGRTILYKYVNNLIYRICVDSKNSHEVDKQQLVVPSKLRQQVLHLAHESLVAGHFSHRKTAEKVFQNFFWPGATADIQRYCRSCYICQKVTPKGKIKPAPLDKMPVISEPFSRVAIDLIGPFSPASKRGHKYILTLIDYATRYPEAVPLKSIDTVTVAEALMDIFSRVGVPYEILSDNGSQFRSDLMAEIHKLLSIKALYTSPYHAACNGLVERMNGTLKSILKKICTDHPQDWDRYIPAALFAYRELPNDTLKFSPFELLYGRTVRGPLTILHELWSKDDLKPEVRTTY